RPGGGIIPGHAARVEHLRGPALVVRDGAQRAGPEVGLQARAIGHRGVAQRTAGLRRALVDGVVFLAGGAAEAVEGRLAIGEVHRPDDVLDAVLAGDDLADGDEARAEIGVFIEAEARRLRPHLARDLVVLDRRSVEL